MAALQDQEEQSSEVDKCGECTQDTAGHTIIRIVRVGEVFKYVVPSFPVFEARLAHVEYCIIAGEEEDGTVYDGFIRHVDGLCDDTTLRLCVGHKYAFFITKEEFRRSIDISGPDLYTPFGNDLFVMWQWTVIQSEPGDSETEGVAEREDECSSSSDELDNARNSPTNKENLYSIVFKCIGSTKEDQYQETLAGMALKKRSGEQLEVRIHSEPLNPFDSRAIAVQCFYNDKWERVGYLVRDVLEEVHQAFEEKKLCEVEME